MARPSDEVEEAIRTSHCAHPSSGDSAHRCVGTCTITPTGVELACGLCGSGSVDRFPSYPPTVRARAESILGAAGLRFNALAADTQARVLAATAADLCPECGVQRPLGYATFYSCSCAGMKWSQYDGWRRATPHAGGGA